MDEERLGMIAATGRRTNLADMVFEKMKERIMSGGYEKGKLLPTQEELSAEFGVSRTVMRDAFHKLSSLGLVEIRQGKGSIVRASSPLSIVSSILQAFRMDESWIQDLMEARYHLERSISSLAARRITREDLLRLEENLAAMEKAVGAGDMESFARIDLEFHEELARISRNKILQRALEAIRGVMKDFFEGFSRTPGVSARALNFHRRIYAALRDRDPERAGRGMAEHLGDIIGNLKKNYRIEVLF